MSAGDAFFPSPAEFDLAGNITRLPHPGASVRDVTLVLATAAILIHGNTHDRDPELVANQAAAIADELMKRRAS